jgi:predicted phosphate transport protein (TIGR00153 family)
VSFSRGLRALVKSNDRRFVELLIQQAELASEALQLLQAHTSERGQAHLLEVKEVELRGDNVRRILVDELLHTYATPFDREDLFALSRSIDDILDAANETAIELAMYKIPTPAAFGEMTAALADGARHIRDAVHELLDHPRIAAEMAVRAKRSENRMDNLYHQAVSNLFDSGQEMAAVLKAREIYRHLKNSADRIDRAADQISVIIIKRT